MKKSKKMVDKLSSTTRLEQLLIETESELEAINPRIEKLEKQLEKLRELKLARQKLITLKLSVQSILNNFSSNDQGAVLSESLVKNLSGMTTKKGDECVTRAPHPTANTSVGQMASWRAPMESNRVFLPERAFQEVNQVLRRKTSINYELFRAIVFHGGAASTEQIKQYLVEHRIAQPGNGDSFESVALTDISSRVNYLVRKGVVRADGRGVFVSLFGWAEPEPLMTV